MTSWAADDVNDFQITVGALRETFVAELMYAESAATLINLHCVMSISQTCQPTRSIDLSRDMALMHINAVSLYLVEFSCLCQRKLKLIGLSSFVNVSNCSQPNFTFGYFDCSFELFYSESFV